MVLESIEAGAIMVAYPLLLFLGEHVLEHHARLDRHACQPLKAEPALIRVVVLRAHVTHDEDGLDADTEFVRLVCFEQKAVSESVIKRGGCGLTVAGLVRENVATS